MSKQLEAALIQLGIEQPALRHHIRPILAHLPEDAPQGKVAALDRNELKKMSPELLFQELRSAVGRNDAQDIFLLRQIHSLYHSGPASQQAKRYLYGQLKGKFLRAQVGDTVYLYTYENDRLVKTAVTVLENKAAIESQYPDLSRYYLFVKKPRGKAEGRVYSLDTDFMYQATMRTQTQYVVWASFS